MSHSFSVFLDGHLGVSSKLGRCHGRQTNCTSHGRCECNNCIWVTLGPMTGLGVVLVLGLILFPSLQMDISEDPVSSDDVFKDRPTEARNTM